MHSLSAIHRVIDIMATSPTTTVRIAVAARTPIYLPLYLAKHRNFYDKVPAKFQLELHYLQKGGTADRDRWVANSVHDSKDGTHNNIWFGVCDPHVAVTKTDLRVIAALVTQNPFCYVTNYEVEDRTLDVLKAAAKVFTYGKGMTGHTLHTRFRERIDYLETKPVQTVPPDADVTMLAHCDEHAALLTTDIPAALGNKDISMAFSCCRDKGLGDLFSCGIIATKEIVSGQGDGPTVTKALLAAIQRALVDLRFCGPQVAMDALKNGAGHDATIDATIMEDTIRHMVEREGLFPVESKTTFSMWTRLLEFHKERGPHCEFAVNVHNDVAHEVFADVLKRVKLYDGWRRHLRILIDFVKEHPYTGWVVAVFLPFWFVMQLLGYNLRDVWAFLKSLVSHVSG